MHVILYLQDEGLFNETKFPWWLLPGMRFLLETFKWDSGSFILLVLFYNHLKLMCSAGIMVTSKQRQEFRIKLQRRARKRLDKKIECLIEDIEWREVSPSSLDLICWYNLLVDIIYNECYIFATLSLFPAVLLWHFLYLRFRAAVCESLTC